MAFDPGLKIGQILKNADIVEIFKCGNMEIGRAHV